MTWYDPAFGYKKSIVIPREKVSGGSDLLDFPLLISVTDSSLKSQSNGGLVASTNGYDLLFTDETEIRELPYEVESYTASSGALVCWVRVPVLSASHDTVLYLYFGNSAVTGFQAIAANVWSSSYKVVYHLSDNVATTTIVDSTPNAYNGTAVANTSTKHTTGEIVGGLTFNGTSDVISVSNFALGGTSLTVSCWVYSTNFAQNGFLVEVQPINSTWDFFLEGSLKLRGGGTASTLGVSSPSNNAWHYLVGTITGTTGSLFIDGVQMASGPVNAIPLATNTLTIGAFTDSGGGYYFSGTLDEMRIVNVARTFAWIATEYANQSSPSSFVWIGATIPFTGNVSESVLIVSSQTTTQTSADQLNVGSKGVALTFNITACGSGETFFLTVQGKDATTGAYYNIAAFGGIGLGTTPCTVYPGGNPSATTASAALPKVWRVYVTPGTADSSTYTVGASLLS